MIIRPGIQRTMSRTIVAWAAILAVLMIALAPAVSALLQRGQAQPQTAFWMQICSAFSSQYPALANAADSVANRADPTQRQHRVAAHCPYCVMHASVTMPTPGTGTMMMVAAQVLYQLAPALFYQAPQSLFAWTVALSRAPPGPLALPLPLPA